MHYTSTEICARILQGKTRLSKRLDHYFDNEAVRTNLEKAMHDAEHDACEPKLHGTFVELLRRGRDKVIELDGIDLNTSEVTVTVGGTRGDIGERRTQTSWSRNRYPK